MPLPLPKTSVATAWTCRISKLEENAGVADLSLDKADLAEIRTATSSLEVVGERYPEQLQRMIDR